MSTAEPAPVRWGILGTGDIAATFTEDLLIPGDHVVAAVGSRDARRARKFAGTYGIERSYGSYEDLAADVIALARDRGLFAMEAMWTRFNPLVREIRDLVAGGAIGRVTAIQADLGGAPAYQPERRLWNPDLAGGALLDLGVYPLSFASMLLGEPDAVHALAALAPTGVDANTAIIARYPGGAVGDYHCGLWATSPRTATITGTGGWITVGSPFYRPAQFAIARGGGEPETRSISLARPRIHLPGR